MVGKPKEEKMEQMKLNLADYQKFDGIDLEIDDFNFKTIKNNAIANAKCVSAIYQLYPRNISQRFATIFSI